VAGAAAHLDWPALRCPELLSADALAMNAQAARADVIVLGPGLGQSEWSERVFARFIAVESPLVIDADGLNLLARSRCSRRDDWTLTPHPGEAARLLDCAVREVQADRLAAAREIVAKFGGTCVLKGAGTLVVNANDDGALLCDRGNPGMASAGMGDVLAGVIGALRARGLPHAVAVAVWLHSAAADLAADELGERSLLARDVIAHLGRVLRAC
ncbi:MAG: NAD(P)H-hydrate dehydratase, partial [bacterium]